MRTAVAEQHSCHERDWVGGYGLDLCRRPTGDDGDFCTRHRVPERCARSVRTPQTFADRHQCRIRRSEGSIFCRRHAEDQ